MSWQHVRGHDLLVRGFADIVARGRLAHAYLFVGPAGVGKRLFARELAKTLLCESREESFNACDRCSACSLVDAATHPDLIFASRPEDKNDFPIDAIRELIEGLSLKPARGGSKIAIIDDADDFNDASANAFLKTLEEPPPRSLLILIATDPERQLPTILSRSQVVRFAALPIPLVAELLRTDGVADDLSERLARFSGGSLGKARELADEELWKFRRELVDELAKKKPETVRLAKRWMSFVEEAGKDGAKQRRRATLTIDLLIELLHHALNVSVGGEAARVESEDRDAIHALATRLGTEGLLRLIDRCLDANNQIDRRVQLVLTIEALADALAN